MSNALLEAMAAGCAIIATDIPENRELIENNKNGILINWNDLKQLGKIINKLADNKDLRLELGGKAQEKAKEFDIERKIIEWEEWLRSLS